MITRVDSNQPSTKTQEFYRRCLKILAEAKADFLIGGAYALRHHTGISRFTKDLDIFVRPEDCERTLSLLAAAGYKTEIRSPAWLAKVFDEDAFIDVIFRSGNGIATVDDLWFERSEPTRLFDVDVRCCAAEETIWSKAFTMERERFDLADVMHVIQAKGEYIDWQYLLDRFGEHWRVLFSYLVLFGFVYPGERDAVPDWVIEELSERLAIETRLPVERTDVCKGTLLSNAQFLVDVLFRGYQDARFCGWTDLTTEELGRWRLAIDRELGDRLKAAALVLPQDPPCFVHTVDGGKSSSSQSTAKPPGTLNAVQ